MLTPRSDEIDQLRRAAWRTITVDFERALALCRQLELELGQARQEPLFSTREDAARWRWWKPWIERRVGDLAPYEAQPRATCQQPVDETDNLYTFERPSSPVNIVRSS